ncbi:hypothetical protein EV121DRAFT_297387 [Schizophyllum commune]
MAIDAQAHSINNRGQQEPMQESGPERTEKIRSDAHAVAPAGVKLEKPNKDNPFIGAMRGAFLSAMGLSASTKNKDLAIPILVEGGSCVDNTRLSQDNGRPSRVLRPDWNKPWGENTIWHDDLILFARAKVPQIQPSVTKEMMLAKSDVEMVARMKTVFKGMQTGWKAKHGVVAGATAVRGPARDAEEQKTVQKRKQRKTRLCLRAGVHFEAAILTSAKLPKRAREIVGSEPEHYDHEYLDFKDGGRELFSAYKTMVRDLCSQEHAPSFVHYGGWVAALAAHFGEEQLQGRVGSGVHIATRLYKSAKVLHPYGLAEEIVVERPSNRDINKLLGLARGHDGKTFSLFPPSDLWAEYWPGNGEWNTEEQNYFKDIVEGLESGRRGALSHKRWTKQLQGLRNSLLLANEDRRAPGLSSADVRSWVSVFDWAYEVKDDTIRLAAVGPDFRAHRLPLFR